MKNIYEILKSVGLEVPADKKADFDKAVLENYKTAAETEKLRTARDNYKTRLDTATEQLKAFEGVNVDDLQGKITTLNQQLADQKADFEKQLADRDFDEMLNGAISGCKAKNVKAVRALLDLEAIKASKNQSADIADALKKVKDCVVKPQSYGGAQGGVNIPYNVEFAGNRQKGTATLSDRVPTYSPPSS